MTERALARLAWLLVLLPLTVSCAAGTGSRPPENAGPAMTALTPEEAGPGPAGATRNEGAPAVRSGSYGTSADRPPGGDPGGHAALPAAGRAPGNPLSPRPSAGGPPAAVAGASSTPAQPSEPEREVVPARPPRLDDLIRAEEARVAAPGAPAESWRSLALLYAAAGRMEDVYRTLEGKDLGRDPLLRLVFAAAGDRVNEHEAALRALEAVRADWRAIHPLRIPHAAFCSAARGFQDFTPYPADTFQPGQVVGVYLEIDNFASRAARGGEYEVSIHADVDVLTPPPNEQTIRLPEADRYTQDLERRTPRPIDDFSLGLRVRLPPNLVPGAYRLRLTVEDRIARKFAVKFLDFAVR